MNEHTIPSPSTRELAATGVELMSNLSLADSHELEERPTRCCAADLRAYLEEHLPTLGRRYSLTSAPQHADWDEV